MLQNVRYGWRQLRNAPVFTLTALVSLALGIGASVTMFSAFRAVFLRSIPYRDADQIVEIEKTDRNGATPADTLADLDFFRRYATSFQTAAGYGYFDRATLSGIPEPADLWVNSVSKELFPLLGSKPLLGRIFGPADFERNAQHTVVLSFRAWRKYFGGDPNIVGRTIDLGAQSRTVIGVMPRDFYFPKEGIAAWLPDLKLSGSKQSGDAQRTFTAIAARLRPGVSVQRAGSELSALTPALLRTYPASERTFKLNLEQVTARETEDYRSAFLLLLGASGFLVLLSCCNAASLLLSRATARKNEFGVRAAMGARRRHLMIQVLTESLLLGAMSGGFGVLLAYGGNRLLVHLLPPSLHIPRLEDAHVDLAVLCFAVLLSVTVAIFFGLVPAFAMSSINLTSADRQGRSTRANTWLHGWLLVGEIAVALILFAGSVLMLRGFIRLANIDPGFRTAHILTAGVPPPSNVSHLSRAAMTQRYTDLLRSVQSMPGVEKAALTGYLPLGSIHVQIRVYVPAVSVSPFQFDYHAVSPDYFEVMGIPLLQGRAFSELDPSSDKGAVVINRAMAQKYWPHESAIGQHLSSRPFPSPPDLTVIGVAGNTRHDTLNEEPTPELYQSYLQYLGPAAGAALVLRTYGEPAAIAPALRQAIHRFDPNQVVENERTLNEVVEESISAPRFYTVLLGVFALLALALTLIGVYGVASYGIGLRTREFGIRMALGAQRNQIIGMLVRQGLWKALAGVAVGACGAWALARFMSGLVYRIPVKDPVSLGIAGACLIAGALAAYYLPARRNTKIDPATVLRLE